MSTEIIPDQFNHLFKLDSVDSGRAWYCCCSVIRIKTFLIPPTSPYIHRRTQTGKIYPCSSLRIAFPHKWKHVLLVVCTCATFYCILLLLLLACAITRYSYVQSIVLEPCSRLIMQINEAIDPLGWSVDGAASTGDMVCRLFGTTVTSVNCHSCTILNCIVRLRFRIAICVFVHKETML